VTPSAAQKPVRGHDTAASHRSSGSGVRVHMVPLKVAAPATPTPAQYRDDGHETDVTPTRCRPDQVFPLYVATSPAGSPATQKRVVAQLTAVHCTLSTRVGEVHVTPLKTETPAADSHTQKAALTHDSEPGINSGRPAGAAAGLQRVPLYVHIRSAPLSALPAARQNRVDGHDTEPNDPPGSNGTGARQLPPA
jgi:hypothetical protein